MKLKIKQDSVDALAEKHLRACESQFRSEERVNAETIWQQLVEFIMPNHYHSFPDHSITTKGTKRTDRLFDSTAIEAADELSRILHSVLTSQGIKWFRLRFTDDELNESDIYSTWLEKQEKRLYKFFNASNFETEIGESYLAYLVLGNLILIMEEKKIDGDFVGFKFNNWHLSQCVVSENDDGAVNVVYRRFKRTVRQIVERWGDQPLPREIVDAYEAEPEKEYEIVRCVYPKDNYKKDSLGQKVSKGDYVNLFILAKHKQILEEAYYQEFPIFVPRAVKSPHEVYGRGIGHKVLPNIRTLNTYVRSDLKSRALAAEPPIVVNESNVIGDLHVVPRAVLTVKDIDKIKPFNDGTRFDVNNDGIEKLRDSIKRAFYLDKLVLPPRKEIGQMTAFEVAERRADAQRVLGPLVSRLDVELIRPLVHRGFDMLLRAGILDKIPAGLQRAQIKVEAVNPLNRTQNAEDLTAINAWFQYAAQFASLGKPEAIDYIDVDGGMRKAAEVLNVPQQVQADKRAIQQAGEERKQQIAAMQQAEQGVKQADMQAKMAKASKEGGMQGGV